MPSVTPDTSVAFFSLFRCPVGGYDNLSLGVLRVPTGSIGQTRLIHEPAEPVAFAVEMPWKPRAETSKNGTSPTGSCIRSTWLVSEAEPRAADSTAPPTLLDAVAVHAALVNLPDDGAIVTNLLFYQGLSNRLGFTTASGSEA
jgi:hypothetical protein